VTAATARAAASPRAEDRCRGLDFGADPPLFFLAFAFGAIFVFAAVLDLDLGLDFDLDFDLDFLAMPPPNKSR
jgi:hypothetical protein